MNTLRFLRRWLLVTVLFGIAGALEYALLPHGGFLALVLVTVWLYGLLVRALFRAWVWDMEQGWFYWLAGRRFPSGRW